VTNDERSLWMHRRRFFTRSAQGLGVAALASLLGEDGLAAATHHPAKATKGIFIFLIGGTSQVDLFDPKPRMKKLDGQPIPESFRGGVRLGQTSWKAPLWASPFGFRRYGQCGMELSEMLPHTGAHADRICLIRSLHHEAFDHAPGELVFTTGKDRPGRPSLGSWLAYGLGRESRDLPSFVVLVNGRSPKARELVWGAGTLPATHQGVLFRSAGSAVLNLQTPEGVTDDCHRLQLGAIAKLDALTRRRTADPALDARLEAYELAFRMQTSSREALDLSREPLRVVESYGPGDFARSLLLARRLVERGVRFVMVTHNVWDHHDSLARDLPAACAEVDRPTGALLRDLEGRGLLDTTLVACGSEFGRTAITQGDPKRPGRDHHPHAFSVWLAGAGVKGGQVVGKTDELGWRPVEDAVHLHDFHATLLHLFGLDHKRLTVRHQGLDVRLTDVAGKVVAKVLA
jgi:hypothetical protein